MEEQVGIYRDGGALAKAADKLQELRERFGRAAMTITAEPSTPNCWPLSSCRSCLDVARCIVAEPSPGRVPRRAPAHRFPRRDDQRYLAHSTIHRNPDGSGRVSTRR